RLQLDRFGAAYIIQAPDQLLHLETRPTDFLIQRRHAHGYAGLPGAELRLPLAQFGLLPADLFLVVKERFCALYQSRIADHIRFAVMPEPDIVAGNMRPVRAGVLRVLARPADRHGITGHDD